MKNKILDLSSASPDPTAGSDLSLHLAEVDHLRLRLDALEKGVDGVGRQMKTCCQPAVDIKPAVVNQIQLLLSEPNSTFVSALGQHFLRPSALETQVGAVRAELETLAESVKEELRRETRRVEESLETVREKVRAETERRSKLSINQVVRGPYF